jgi:uncharacterized membrane protein
MAQVGRMESSSPISYALAGALAGGRTTAGPSFVCRRLGKRDDVPQNRLLRAFKSKPMRIALKASSAAELVADKLPMIGSRTRPLPLALRTVSGAVSGAALASADRRNAMLGAALGAVGALAGTFATSYLRGLLLGRLRVPAILAGLAEDAALMGLRRFA